MRSRFDLVKDLQSALDEFDNSQWKIEHNHSNDVRCFKEEVRSHIETLQNIIHDIIRGEYNES